MGILRNQLLSVMDKNNWSITRLSVECGISARELSYILSGKKIDIRLSTVMKIAEGIERPVSCLISEEGLNKYKNEALIYKLYAEIGNYINEGV